MPFHSPFAAPTSRPGSPPADGEGTTGAASPMSGRWAGYAAMAVILLLATLVGSSASAHVGPGRHDAEVRSVVFPVAGPVSYSDTWGACRGRGCSRSHKGVDIFAPRLTPLIAAADGVIISERRSALTIAGNALTIKDDEGWRYVYVHLNNDSPGTDDGANPQSWILADRLRLGDRVEAGQVIGYMGDSGNAETTPVHLHFEIRKPGVGAINPTLSVDMARNEDRVADIGPLTSTDERRAEFGSVVDAWYQLLLDRPPSEDELHAWSHRLAIGMGTVDDLIADLTMDKTRRDPAGMVVRTYEVVLDRLPTIDELRGWETQLDDGTEHAAFAASLLLSDEFAASTAATSGDEAFVRAVYRNAIGNEPSGARVQDWLEAFADGTTRADLVVHLADSYFVKNATWHDLEVVQAFRASLDRMPTTEEWERWVQHLDTGGLIPDVVEAIRAPKDQDETADDVEESTGEASGEPGDTESNESGETGDAEGPAPDDAVVEGAAVDGTGTDVGAAAGDADSETPAPTGSSGSTDETEATADTDNSTEVADTEAGGASGSDGSLAGAEATAEGGD